MLLELVSEYGVGDAVTFFFWANGCPVTAAPLAERLPSVRSFVEDWWDVPRFLLRTSQ